jgi:hypothetical protein
MSDGNWILSRCIPSVELVYKGCIMAIQNTQEVNKECLPDIKLNLVHKIYRKHTELAQTEYCELARKSTLKKLLRYGDD